MRHVGTIQIFQLFLLASILKHTYVLPIRTALVLILIIIRNSRRTALAGWNCGLETGAKVTLLRLNRMTDYAIVVLGALAHRHSEVLATAQIASLTGLTQTTVAKVAKRLQACDLLETKRGVNGGYQLTGDPATLSLTMIIEAVDGPIAVNGCVDGAQDPCAVSNCCFMSNQWNKVNDTVRDALDAVSLAELIDPSQLFPLPEQETAPAETSRVSAD